MTNIQWHPVRRVVHLEGGLRAINNPGSRVIIDPWTIDKKTVQFDLPNYQSLLIVLNSLKIDVFGIDYYSIPDQLSGIYPPEWHSYGRIITTSDPLKDSVRSWRNIAFNASKEKNYFLADLSRRIGFQLRACETRLRDISQA